MGTPPTNPEHIVCIGVYRKIVYTHLLKYIAPHLCLHILVINFSVHCLCFLLIVTKTKKQKTKLWGESLALTWKMSFWFSLNFWILFESIVCVAQGQHQKSSVIFVGGASVYIQISIYIYYRESETDVLRSSHDSNHLRAPLRDTFKVGIAWAPLRRWAPQGSQRACWMSGQFLQVHHHISKQPASTVGTCTLSCFATTRWKHLSAGDPLFHCWLP